MKWKRQNFSARDDVIQIERDREGRGITINGWANLTSYFCNGHACHYC